MFQNPDPISTAIRSLTGAQHRHCGRGWVKVSLRGEEDESPGEPHSDDLPGSGLLHIPRHQLEGGS